jgi:hypothetical protein
MDKEEGKENKEAAPARESQPSVEESEKMELEESNKPQEKEIPDIGKAFPEREALQGKRNPPRRTTAIAAHNRLRQMQGRKNQNARKSKQLSWKWKK